MTRYEVVVDRYNHFSEGGKVVVIAEETEVCDEHLYFRDDDGNTIATFASGCWSYFIKTGV